MIYDPTNYSDVEVETTEVVEEEMRFADDSQSVMFQMFSKGIYSNAIGSVVREITSNCFDSHVEAKVDFPVLIKKSYDNETKSHYISFIDYGVGMSPERIDKVYREWFKSTKRDDNTQIGCWGLGSKTPFAYRRLTGFGDAEFDNSYNIITIFNGIKYTYFVYMGKTKPKFSLLNTEPTTERNGTEIRVPVLERDIQKFEQEMVKQLYYFENIIFEGFDKVILNNDYQILQGKEFLYRGSDVSSYMHVCLGKVAYPIDYNVLGLESSDYGIPVALRLNIGDINVTVSRENLDYNEATIKLLKKKLESCKAELVEMLVKQYESIVTLKDYFEYKNNFGNLVFGNKSILLGKVIKAKDVALTNFKFSELPVLDSGSLFDCFFNVKIYGKKEKNGRNSWRHRGEDNSEFLNRNYDGLLKNNKNVYFCDGNIEIKRIKQAWLKEQHLRYYIITKKDDFIKHTLHNEDEDIISVKLYDVVNNKLTDLGLLYVEAQEEYFNVIKQHANDYNAVVIPDDFVINRKRNTLSDDIKNSTIPIKFYYGNNQHRSEYENKERIRVSELIRYKSIIYYGTVEDEDKLKEARNIFLTLFDCNVSSDLNYIDTGKKRANGTISGHMGIIFIQLAKGNIRYMEYCKNAHHVSEFKDKMLHRKEGMVTNYFQNHKLYEDYLNIDSLYRCEIFKLLSLKYYNKIEEIKNYINALPKKCKENNLDAQIDLLKRYYDIDNVVLTKEQKRIAKLIEKVKALEVKNEKIFDYVNVNHYILDDSEKNNVLIDILSKVMDLK